MTLLFCSLHGGLTLKDEDIGKSMRLGKFDQAKKRPILIAIRTEDKKREIFQNLHKLRQAPNNISVSHDMTKKQREELQELIKEAKNKEENDQSGNVMYRVRGPPMGMVHKENQQKIRHPSRTRLHSLSCMYTNADQFRRKFPEFTVRINKEQPMIIGITEVKPKNSMDKLFPAEFSIDNIGDYDSPFCKNITTNIGRGILLYVHKQLQAKEVEMKTEFQEALFVEINLNEQDKLLVGCIYRSESGTEENNNNLRAMVREAASKSYSHILMMGDFNYPDINWKNWTTKSENTENQEFKFIECIRDNFLSQHVQEPTRVRGNDTPNLLDLIFTKKRI